jgi:hypothetical protein
LHAYLSGAPGKGANIYIMTLNGLYSASDCKYYVIDSVSSLTVIQDIIGRLIGKNDCDLKLKACNEPDTVHRLKRVKLCCERLILQFLNVPM